jgi:hypothetical protein
MGLTLLTERHANQIAGVMSCYDRVIVQGTLPVFCYAAVIGMDLLGFRALHHLKSCGPQLHDTSNSSIALLPREPNNPVRLGGSRRFCLAASTCSFRPSSIQDLARSASGASFTLRHGI